MNKLIWKMYNENRISLEVAEELLDCYYIELIKYINERRI